MVIVIIMKNVGRLMVLMVKGGVMLVGRLRIRNLIMDGMVMIMLNFVVVVMV